PENIRGLEYLRSPCHRRAILTRAGNADVGVANGRPQPLRGYGDATARAVAANGTLFLNPDWLNVDNDEPAQHSEFETWMLLVCRTGDRVQAELSHPAGEREDGRVDRWIERILLPEIDYSETSGRNLDDAPIADEIDVPITRKR